MVSLQMAEKVFFKLWKKFLLSINPYEVIQIQMLSSHVKGLRKTGYFKNWNGFQELPDKNCIQTKRSVDRWIFCENVLQKVCPLSCSAQQSVSLQPIHDSIKKFLGFIFSSPPNLTGVEQSMNKKMQIWKYKKIQNRAQWGESNACHAK